jgi:adenylate cyclase
VVDTGGTEVKDLGDGMMIAFERSLADAARCAIEMQRSVDRLSRADPLLRLRIRIGLSVGEAAPEGRDWNGTPVVEAARLESKARPGQILANDMVRQLLGTRGGFEFTPVGAYELRGSASRSLPVSVVGRARRTT